MSSLHSKVHQNYRITSTKNYYNWLNFEWLLIRIEAGAWGGQRWYGMKLHHCHTGIKVNTVITSLTEIVYTKNRITNVCIYLLAAELKTAAHGSNSWRQVRSWPGHAGDDDDSDIQTCCDLHCRRFLQRTGRVQLADQAQCGCGQSNNRPPACSEYWSVHCLPATSSRLLYMEAVCEDSHATGRGTVVMMMMLVYKQLKLPILNVNNSNSPSTVLIIFPFIDTNIQSISIVIKRHT